MSNYQKEFGRDSSLPIFALVLSIALPPVGAIMGHVALHQMKTGEVNSMNRTFALVAVVLGWVGTAILLMALPVILILIGLTSFFDSLTHY